MATIISSKNIMQQHEINNNNGKDRSSSLVSRLVCGAVSGVIGTCLIYPVDLTKTRLQCIPGKRKVFSVINQIWKQNGLAGFYRGLPANLIGIAPEKAIKLAVNDYVRDKLALSQTFMSENNVLVNLNENNISKDLLNPSVLSESSSKNLPVSAGIIAGASAGICQVVVTCPLESIKIQLQMESVKQQKHNGFKKAFVPESLLQVLQRMGLKNLYRGAGATAFRDVPFSIIFFPMHAWLKDKWPLIVSSKRFNKAVERESSGLIETNQLKHLKNKKKDSNHNFVELPATSPPLWWIFTSGIVAGCSAASLVTPMDVIKTRIQSDCFGKSTGILDIFRQIIDSEGPRALFKGVFPRCLIISPLFGISVLLYEGQKKYLAST